MMEGNTLKAFVVKHFGNHRQLAQLLGVSTSTVTHWTHDKPRNLLKYAPEILGHREAIEYTELLEAVTAREAELDAA